MAAPTVANRLASAFNSATTPKTAGPFTCGAGDLLMVKGQVADAGGTINTPTGGTGLTWTQKVNIGTSGSSGRVTQWTTIVGSAQTITVSCAATGVTGNDWGIEVVQYSAHGGVGVVASGQISSGSGAPSITLTGASADSAAEMTAIDWAATATTSKAYRTSDAGTFTETAAATVSGQLTYYQGRYADVGAAGNKVIGLSAPTTMRWTAGAVEVLAPSGGTTFTQTVSAICAAVAITTRAGAVIRSGQAAASAVVTKAAAKTATTIVGAAAAVSRAGAKAIRAAGASSASIVAVKAKLVTVAASCAAVAAKTAQASKTTTTSAAAAASLIRAAAKTLAATVAGSATALAQKVLLKTISAAAASSAQLMRAARSTRAAVAGTPATLTRSESATRVATAAAAAAVTKAPAKTLAGACAAAAIAAAQRVRLITITSTAATSAVLRRQVTAGRAGSAGAAATIVRAVSAARAAGAGAAAAIAKRAGKTIAGTASSLASIVSQLITGGIHPSRLRASQHLATELELAAAPTTVLTLTAARATELELAQNLGGSAT